MHKSVVFALLLLCACANPYANFIDSLAVLIVEWEKDFKKANWREGKY